MITIKNFLTVAFTFFLSQAMASDLSFNSKPEYNSWHAKVSKQIESQEYLPTLQEKDNKGNVFHKGAKWHFVNRKQELRSYINNTGWELLPKKDKWHWKYTLINTSDSPPIIEKENDRVTLKYSNNITEWYQNSPAGIEQGFKVEKKQTSGNEIIIQGKVETDLKVNSFSKEKITFSTNEKDVLIYRGLKVIDSNGTILPSYMSWNKNKSVIDLHIYDTNAVYPIIIDPIASSPSWTAESNQADSLFTASVSTAGDVNGDGFSDVIIGASSYDNGQIDEGRIYAFYGSANGLSLTPDWIAESDQSYSYYASSSSTAGDVNGDGYSDIIVGAFRFTINNTAEGKVFVYYGSSNGLSTTPSWTLNGTQDSAELGYAVSTAGDVNGDGYSDIIIGARNFDNGMGQANEGQAYVYLGSANGLSTSASWVTEANQANANYGHAVSTAGDVNGDGYSDVIVGAYNYDNDQVNEGRAYVYLGSAGGLATTPIWTAESNQVSSLFASSVSAAGDVNGDGYADIIIGAAYYDNGETNEGRAYVYHGSSSGPSTSANWITESNQSDSLYGYRAASAGDINGDGYGDIIIGATDYDNGQSNEGRIFAYLGSATGLSSVATWTAETDQNDSEFGWGLSTAGDVNGDGFSDIIVGSRFYDNGQTDEGRAFLYYGSADGLSLTNSWSTESDQTDSEYGFSVSNAGDVNGDGYSDIIVGAHNYDNGQTDEGRVFVFHGSSSGLATSSNWTTESNQSGAEFGYSISSAGDINGDGYTDVAIGAPYYENGQSNEGMAFIYHGSPSGLATSPTWTTESNLNDANLGFSVSNAGDVNGDGYSDVIIGAPFYTNGELSEGKAYVYHGSSTRLSTNASWTTESNQIESSLGYVVSSAGDINKDGYSDVIIGAPFYTNGEPNEGRAFVYHGSSSGLSTNVNWTAESNQNNANFSNSVSSTGDVNGDGYSDIVIGAPYFDNSETNEGRTFVYHGSSVGLPTNANWTAESNQIGALFGTSVSSAGDVNGDGYSDTLVGAPSFDNGEINEGKAFVYHGSSTGLSTSANWTAEANQINANFSYSASSAGDVNGDGYSDIIIGAAYFDNGQTNEGSAFVYYGNNSGGLTIRPIQTKENDSPIHTLGNLNYNSYKIKLLSRTPFGRTRSRIIYENKSLSDSLVSTGLTYGAWTDNTLTGTELSATVNNLVSGTRYHWRARIQYFPYMNYSPWYSTGNNSKNETDLIFIDPSPPTTPGKPDLQSTSDLGSSNTDNTTSKVTPVFDITCTNGFTVKIKEGNTVLESGICTDSSIALTSSTLAVGTHNIFATQISTSGTESTSSETLTITISLDDDFDGLNLDQEITQGTDPNNADTDNDGVNDGQEVLDGTAPLDRGSSISVLPTTICSPWNGFLKDPGLAMWNIMEHVNLSSSQITVRSTLYDISGVEKSSRQYDIAPGTQSDLIVHDMTGWTLNSYGQVCSTILNGNPGDMDGRMVYYKPTSSGGFEFAFAIPFSDGIKGTQFAPFNTFQPSLNSIDSGNVVANWIQITNQENTNQQGVVFFYNQDGSVLGQFDVNLSAKARQDYSAHQYGASRVGLVEFRPNNNSARISLQNIRYYHDNANFTNSFSGAFELDGSIGSGQGLSVPLDTVGSTSVLEVGNTENAAVTARVRVYDLEGIKKLDTSINLAAHASIHLIMDSVLTNSKGTAYVTASNSSVDRIIATAMQYGYTSTNQIQTIYGIPAKQSLGSVLKTSYNTFINQNCSLFVTNPTNSIQNASIRIVRLDGTVVVPDQSATIAANGGFVYDACSKDIDDTYGVITLSPNSPNTLYGTLIRQGSLDAYRFSTLVR